MRQNSLYRPCCLLSLLFIRLFSDENPEMSLTCHIQCLNSPWAQLTPDKSLYMLAAAVCVRAGGTPAFDPPCERLTWFWLSVKTPPVWLLWPRTGTGAYLIDIWRWREKKQKKKPWVARHTCSRQEQISTPEPCFFFYYCASVGETRTTLPLAGLFSFHV